MLYYYKRPGDWLWRRLDTSSIAAAAHGHRVSSSWRFRVEGDSTDRTLAELIEMERVAQEHARSQAPDSSFLAPDATWGYITVVLCLMCFVFLAVVPSQQPHSHGKLWLSGLALVWLSHGVTSDWRGAGLEAPAATTPRA